MNLVGLAGGPQKPEALVKYEAKKARAVQAKSAQVGLGAPKAPLTLPSTLLKSPAHSSAAPPF